MVVQRRLRDKLGWLSWTYRPCTLLCVMNLMWVSPVQAQGAPTGGETFFSTHTADVVFIKVSDKTSKNTLPATGTGTLLQNGYVLTAKHVIEAFGNDDVAITGSVGARYGSAVPLDLVVTSQRPLDLALLKFRELPTNLDGVHIGDPDLLKVGASLLTMSFPGDYGLTLTSTQITSAGEAGRWLATAELLPGSSGGPVFDPIGGGVVGIIQTGAPGSAEIIPINQGAPLLLSAGYGIGPLAAALGFHETEIKQLLSRAGSSAAPNPVAALVNQPTRAKTSEELCGAKAIVVNLTNPQLSANRDVNYVIPADSGCRISSVQYRDLSRTRADVAPGHSSTEATLNVHLDAVPLFGARSWAHGVFEITQVPTHQ